MAVVWKSMETFQVHETNKYAVSVSVNDDMRMKPEQIAAHIFRLINSINIKIECTGLF